MPLPNQSLHQTMPPDPKFELNPDDETQRRLREIQLIVNVPEPDSEYQRFILTDLATVFDATVDDEDDIRRKLADYIGQPFNLELSLPLWALADNMRCGTESGQIPPDRFRPKTSSLWTDYSDVEDVTP